jgi:hypothetical protein
LEVSAGRMDRTTGRSLRRWPRPGRVHADRRVHAAPRRSYSGQLWPGVLKDPAKLGFPPGTRDVLSPPPNPTPRPARAPGGGEGRNRTFLYTMRHPLSRTLCICHLGLTSRLLNGVRPSGVALLSVLGESALCDLSGSWE